MSAPETFVVRLEVAPDADAQRLDRFVTDRLPDTSRSFVQRLIDAGGVRVNGQLPRPSQRVSSGDSIEVRVPRPVEPAEITPAHIAVPIVFEDDDVIVFDKPAG